ncbi:MAG: single-stranded DNA-binding protein [Prevotellaceae bacterium]|jgi:single-strand DNA-binding protein|nr:single-stranded DNA-binding protein [Prevotellaceae bacterium]
MHKIIIAGQLGQDAQSREVGENVAINFSVAVNEKRGSEEVTHWYACTLWRNKDKAGVAAHLKKGAGVIVEGTPDVEAWMSKERSEPQARIRVTVRDLHFMTGNKKESHPTAEASAAQAPTPAPAAG